MLKGKKTISAQPGQKKDRKWWLEYISGVGHDDDVKAAIDEFARLAKLNLPFANSLFEHFSKQHINQDLIDGMNNAIWKYSPRGNPRHQDGLWRLMEVPA